MPAGPWGKPLVVVWRAQRNGWQWCITDTTDNMASANSLIKAGYTLYKPSTPLALSNSLYWKKQLRSAKMRKISRR